MHEQMQTLHVVYNTGLEHAIQHSVTQDLRHLHERDASSADVAHDIVELAIGGNVSMLNKIHVEYLALTNHLTLDANQVNGSLQTILSGCKRPERYILSLKPQVVCKSAAETKEEMMRRYEGEGYYFLDGMLETGSITMF